MWCFFTSCLLACFVSFFHFWRGQHGFNLCLSNFSVNLTQNISWTLYQQELSLKIYEILQLAWLKSKLININIIIQQQLALCLQLQSFFYSECTVQSLWKPYANCSSSLLHVGYPAVWDVTYAPCFHSTNVREPENYSVKALLMGEWWLGLSHCWTWQINRCWHGR